MRNEGDRLLEAIDEALAIGKTAGTPVHIFHLKAAGQANWPKMDQAIARINAARASGQQVTADIYPYIHNGLGLEAFLHPRHSGQGTEVLHRKLNDPAIRAEMRRELETLGGWENWFRHIGSDWDNVILGQVRARNTRAAPGCRSARSRDAGKDPWDVFFTIVAAGSSALPRSMSEANVIKAMRQDFTSFCTDMGPLGSEDALIHPRGAGAFPRILARYVRDLGVISLETAIARMTSVAANDLKLYDRGRITPGTAADLVVFDLCASARPVDVRRADLDRRWHHSRDGQRPVCQRKWENNRGAAGTRPATPRIGGATKFGLSAAPTPRFESRVEPKVNHGL